MGAVQRLSKSTERGLLLLLLLAASLGFVSRARAQDGSRAVSVDSADAIRASFVRPPAGPEPAVDAVDVVEFPFKVVLFPISLVAKSIAGVAGLVTLDNPPFPVRAVRQAREWGLTPRIRLIGPRSGTALVIRLTRFDHLFLETGFSVFGSQRHRAGITLGNPGHGLQVDYTFRRDAQDTFWGIGPNSLEDRRSDFLRDKSEARAQGWIHLGPVLGLAGGVAFEDNRVDRGRDGGLPDLQDSFDTDTLFGADQRIKYFRFDLSTTLDFTHRHGFQRRGVWLRAGSALFRGTDGTDSEFHRFTGEVHGYLPLNSQQTLAVRGLVEINRLDNGEGIAFYDLSRLGGSRNGPRGFNSGRFRDRDGLSLMAEWRYEIWNDIEERSRVEGFLLFDAGTVANSLFDVSTGDLRPSYGFGMRVMMRDELAALWYVAFSEEGTEFAVRTEWPF